LIPKSNNNNTIGNDDGIDKPFRNNPLNIGEVPLVVNAFEVQEDGICDISIHTSLNGSVAFGRSLQSATKVVSQRKLNQRRNCVFCVFLVIVTALAITTGLLVTQGYFNNISYFHGLDLEIHGYVVSTLISKGALHPNYATTVRSCDGENQVLAWMGDLANAPIERDQVATVTTTALVQRFTIGLVWVELGGRQHWIDQTLWMSSKSECDWYGLSCPLVRLAEIELVSNGLTGTIPSQLFQLSSLRVIDFSSNVGLHGTLPRELSNIRLLSKCDAGCTMLSFP